MEHVALRIIKMILTCDIMIVGDIIYTSNIEHFIVEILLRTIWGFLVSSLHIQNDDIIFHKILSILFEWYLTIVIKTSLFWEMIINEIIYFLKTIQHTNGIQVCLPTSFCTWWHHQIQTFSELLVLCVGNSPVISEFPSQRLVTGSFDFFFDLRLNKRLSKQLRRWWLDAITLIMTSL